MSMAVVPHEGPGILALDENQKGRILQALGLDMSQPLTQALLLVAERYDLDPLLKQVQIIKQNVYITHAGLLHIAHASGKLDGIVVESENANASHFEASVTVYRKDMTHGFTYPGAYAKSKVRSDGASGREMALKNAERSALRRAFDICAPTMDDSGADFDDVPPGTDIDLPQGIQPPTVVAAIPTPEAEPVAEEPKPKARRAPKTAPPPGVDPETGEMSPNGYPVNPETGGEQIGKAAQARAREIADQAETAETPQKAAAATKTVKRPPIQKPKEKEYPPEVIARAQQLHMTANEQEIEESMLRDVVLCITDKRTSSTRELDAGESELVRSVLVAIGQDLIDYEYDEDGALVLDLTLAPDDADEDEGVVDAEVVTEAKDWKQECSVRNIKDGAFLRKARAFAEEMNITLPSSFRDVTGPALETALWEWIQEFPPHVS